MTPAPNDRSDITAPADIRLLVDTFYSDLRRDAMLGPIFNGKIGDDWSHHTPKIYAFWEAVLLGATGYTGNPMLTHIQLDREFSLTDAHFVHWLTKWDATVDALFTGEKAEEAKKKARMMAGLMMFKIGAAKSPGFIQ